MTPITESEVMQAFRTLFGNDIRISRYFLSSVQPTGVKSAYRKKVKETHPDLFADGPLHVQQTKAVHFREILHAYDVLSLFFKQRAEGAWSDAPRAPRPSGQGQGASSRMGRKDNHFYRGSVPHSILQIGQYLYYRGKISFDTLIDALVWQRKQRPSLGAVALRWGLLDSSDIDRIVRAGDRPRRFGEKAVEQGLLTVFQVNTILVYQRAQQDRLGKYFTQHHFLSAGELERLASELKAHNARVLASSVHTRHN